MPGLVPGIHVIKLIAARKAWMAGTSPAMTTERLYPAVEVRFVSARTKLKGRLWAAFFVWRPCPMRRSLAAATKAADNA